MPRPLRLSMCVMRKAQKGRGGREREGKEALISFCLRGRRKAAEKMRGGGECGWRATRRAKPSSFSWFVARRVDLRPENSREPYISFDAPLHLPSTYTILVPGWGAFWEKRGLLRGLTDPQNSHGLLPKMPGSCVATDVVALQTLTSGGVGG